MATATKKFSVDLDMGLHQISNLATGLLGSDAVNVIQLNLGLANRWGPDYQGAGTGMDADLLDGEEGSYYLNWDNITNKPFIPEELWQVNGDDVYYMDRVGIGLSAPTAMLHVNGIAKFNGGIARSSIVNTTNYPDDLPAEYIADIANDVFYNSFVSNHTNFPYPYGPLFGYGFHSNSHGYSWQLFKGKGGLYGDTGDLFYRSARINVWQSWERIWHSGNDGAGSTLDADLLDGEEGTYYLDYNNLVNVPNVSQAWDGVGVSQPTSVDDIIRTGATYLGQVGIGKALTTYQLEVKSGNKEIWFDHNLFDGHSAAAIKASTELDLGATNQLRIYAPLIEFWRETEASPRAYFDITGEWILQPNQERVATFKRLGQNSALSIHKSNSYSRLLEDDGATQIQIDLNNTANGSIDFAFNDTVLFSWENEGYLRLKALATDPSIANSAIWGDLWYRLGISSSDAGKFRYYDGWNFRTLATESSANNHQIQKTILVSSLTLPTVGTTYSDPHIFVPQFCDGWKVVDVTVRIDSKATGTFGINILHWKVATESSTLSGLGTFASNEYTLQSSSFNATVYTGDKFSLQIFNQTGAMPSGLAFSITFKKA